ncbi:MAG TPA: hypothetical protein PKZ69_08915 [Candidatus Cloacimonadota bacterium]|nr:hypothetical protein [Candidatus Cloacimonadota bacterium]
MRLIGVFTRFGLSRVVAKRVLKGDFKIDDLKKPSASDITKYCYINDLNNDLTYGYVEEVDINEEL